MTKVHFTPDILPDASFVPGLAFELRHPVMKSAETTRTGISRDPWIAPTENAYLPNRPGASQVSDNPVVDPTTPPRWYNYPRTPGFIVGVSFATAMAARIFDDWRRQVFPSRHLHQCWATWQFLERNTTTKRAGRQRICPRPPQAVCQVRHHL